MASADSDKRDLDFPEMIQGQPVTLPIHTFGVPTRHYWCERCLSLNTRFGPNVADLPPPVCAFCGGPTVAGPESDPDSSP